MSWRRRRHAVPAGNPRRKKEEWTRRDLNPGPLPCEGSDLPLIYEPAVESATPVWGARASVLKYDFDGHVVGDLDAHELAERAFVGIDIDEPFVDAHLPVFPGRGALAVGRLARGHFERLGRQRHRARELDASLLGDVLHLAADAI